MSKEPLILSFDTTNETFSIAISGEKKIKQSFFSETSGMQAEMLIPEIEKLLNKEKIWYSDLSGIAFTIGPGSFTGLRVGFAVAKALHIATSLPLIGVNCLEAIAYPYSQKKKYENKEILVIMDARQKNIFIQRFDSELKALTEPAIIKYKSDELVNLLPKDSSEFVLCGSGKGLVKDIIKDLEKSFIIEDNNDIIDAQNIAKLGMVKLNRKEFDNDVEPLYLRPPRISKRKE